LPAKYTRALLLVYGLLNALLYSSLLPLWEGFDEEFHYGYVQYLDAHARLPVLGRTGLSEEINRSIDLLPMSFVMIQNIRVTGVRTFDQFFALDTRERHALHEEALRIPSELRLEESTRYVKNYEVHHAPLAYLLMAIPDSLLAPVPLPRRVLILRLLVSLACVLLVFRGAFALGREAGLTESYSAALVFLVFSCQMFWATIAHVGNDWLAVPLGVWLIVWAYRCHRAPTLRHAIWTATVLALGLLTKAYFLVFVALYLPAVLIWHRRGTLPQRALVALLAIPLLLAGPWYLRNQLAYGNLSGRLEESSGVTTSAALKSLAAIPWMKSLPFMARGTFWLGNGSFTDFSVRTMNAVLLLLALALLLNYRYLKRDVFLWAPVLLFCAAMVYVTGSSYTYSQGTVTVASPWYLQVVLAPLLCFALRGCQRSGRIGRWVATVTLALWGYILAATYVAKLFPLYGGFSGGRSTLRDIARWYQHEWTRTSDILNTVALTPAPWLVTLLALLLLTLLASLTACLLALPSISEPRLSRSGNETPPIEAL